MIDGEEESEAVDTIALLQLVQTRCFGQATKESLWKIICLKQRHQDYDYWYQYGLVENFQVKHILNLSQSINPRR